MLSVLICFQHTTTIIRVNPSKNNSTESQNLPAIPQITPTINSNFPSTAKAQPPKRVYPLYLWPRSKVWMRALKASIQTAATKVTNIGARLSSGAVLWLGREILFIAGGIWGISRRFWLSVELFFEGLTRIIVVVR